MKVYFHVFMFTLSYVDRMKTYFHVLMFSYTLLNSINLEKKLPYLNAPWITSLNLSWNCDAIYDTGSGFHESSAILSS